MDHTPTKPLLRPASKVSHRQPLGQHAFEESGLLLPRPEAQGRELQKQVGHIVREAVVPYVKVACPYTLGGFLYILAISMPPPPFVLKRELQN